MSSAAARVVVTAVAAVIAAPPPAWGDDVVHLHRGAPVVGSIEARSDASVRVKVTVERAGVVGTATRTIPMAWVKFIDFAPLPGEVELLESPDAAGVEALGALWDAKRRDLACPSSNAGEVALALAGALLRSGSEVAHERALRLFSEVELEDWDARRAAEAAQGRLRALLALGRAGEVMAEAEALAAETDDPALLLHARHVLHRADFDRLCEVVEDHPKWREDDEVRADVAALYNRTLDQFLAPFLFHGSESEAAARGLWFAARTYRVGGELARALECATDITVLYPDSSFAAQARALLAEGAGTHTDERHDDDAPDPDDTE